MKEKEINTIWKVPKYLPYVQPTLTEDLLASAERQLGHKLPGQYIELLKIQNGGYIRYIIQGIPHGQIYGIGPHFPSITDCDWTDYESTVSFELNGLIPFDGDGHWYICFDYRKNKAEPEITCIDTESDTESNIAESFKEYLTLLEIETEGEYVIETNATIAETVSEISRIAKLDFEDPDYYAHGYPVYRSRFNDSWAWLSPNKAPTGFIREDHDRYEELKSQMETTSLRYPEIPDNHLFISVSDDKEREILFKKLANHSFKIRPLKELI